MTRHRLHFGQKTKTTAKQTRPENGMSHCARSKFCGSGPAIFIDVHVSCMPKILLWSNYDVLLWSGHQSTPLTCGVVQHSRTFLRAVSGCKGTKCVSHIGHLRCPKFTNLNGQQWQDSTERKKLNGIIITWNHVKSILAFTFTLEGLLCFPDPNTFQFKFVKKKTHCDYNS